MSGFSSWSDITLKGDDLLDGRKRMAHAENLFDLGLLLPNRIVALPRDEDNAMDIFEEMAVPVRVSIGFLGVAKVKGSVYLLTNYEWVLYALCAGKCTVIDSKLSN